MDTLVQDIQVPAFGPGGGVDHDGVRRDRPGDRDGEILFPGELFLLYGDAAFPEKENAAGPVAAVEAHLPHVQTQFLRQRAGVALLRVPDAREQVLPEPLRAGLDLVLPEDRHKETVQLPETAVRFVRGEVKLLHLEAEPLFRTEPEAQAETETPGHVPAVLLDREREGKIHVGQEVRPVQPPAGDPADLQVPGSDPLRYRGAAEQQAQVSVDQAGVHLLQDAGKEPFPYAAVHIVDNGHQPGLHGAAGLVRPGAQQFRHRILPGKGLFLRPVGIFPQRLFHRSRPLSFRKSTTDMCKTTNIFAFSTIILCFYEKVKRL